MIEKTSFPCGLVVSSPGSPRETRSTPSEPNVVHDPDQIRQRASQAVELPDQDCIEPPPVRVGEKAIEGSALDPGPGHSLIDVLRNDLESAGLRVIPEPVELQVHGLVLG